LDAESGGFGVNDFRLAPHPEKARHNAGRKNQHGNGENRVFGGEFRADGAGRVGLANRVCARREASPGTVGRARVIFRFMFMVVIFAGGMRPSGNLDSKKALDFVAIGAGHGLLTFFG
jgi:hypothetical protein